MGTTGADLENSKDITIISIFPKNKNDWPVNGDCQGLVEVKQIRRNNKTPKMRKKTCDLIKAIDYVIEYFSKNANELKEEYSK